MRIFAILLLILLFSACNITKEQRSLKKQSNRIEKLDRKAKRIATENGLTRKDTVQSIVEYITNPVRIDSVFFHDVDTLLIEKENLSIKYINTPEYIYLSASCDTIVIRDTLEVIVDKIAPIRYIEKDLTQWQQAMMKTGKGLFWLLIVALILLIGRFALKKYFPFIP